MKTTRSEKRTNKIISVIKSRQKSLHVVLENIHDPHNVSAIFRTCDAAGIPKVSLIYNKEKFPRIGKKSSASAFKWVEKEKFKTVEECYSDLRKNGFKIFASAITENAVDVYEIDFTKKCAIVMGNENRGLSDEAIEQADVRFKIPMFGMVQSLNVSVSAAIVIYEALRQRRKNTKFDRSELTKKQILEMLSRWSEK